MDTGPRGDTLLRAVVEACARAGYTPVSRHSSAALSHVELRPAAGCADAARPAGLAITHRPQHCCLQVDLARPPARDRVGAPTRTIYAYYVAQRPEDLPRIVTTFVGLLGSL